MFLIQYIYMNPRQFFTGKAMGTIILFVILGLVWLFFALKTPAHQEKQTNIFPQDLKDETTVTQIEKDELIRVSNPTINATVDSPISVTGEARGYWFFEGSFPLVVVDWNGLIIGQGYATADGEWMTEDFVPFIGTVNFDLPEDTPYKRGALILRKDNPSGLPEFDDALEIPILFK